MLRELLFLSAGLLLAGATYRFLNLVDGDEAEVKVLRRDFAMFWVLHLNMLHETSMGFELPLARHTLKDGRHRLVVAA